uniref:DNA helicase n=1 Tax=Heterorhabditis bacteriophora TaxID=37862 RepID=A0A1I7X7X1_HETBA
MGQAGSQLPEHELEALSIESGLSRKGILTLYNRFISLATHRDKPTNEYFLIEADFQNIAELQQNPLGQRIIDAFFADAE